LSPVPAVVSRSWRDFFFQAEDGIRDEGGHERDSGDSDWALPDAPSSRARARALSATDSAVSDATSSRRRRRRKASHPAPPSSNAAGPSQSSAVAALKGGS